MALSSPLICPLILRNTHLCQKTMQIRMAADTPIFGSGLDLDQLKQLVPDFDAEMFRFTGNSMTTSKHLNILHFGTDLDKVRHETDRIISFMTEKGFEHKRDKNPASLNDADMIIMGSDADHSKGADAVANAIMLGRNGLMPYWDVLWYGTDYTPKQIVTSIMSPLCSGPAFATDGLCLIHAHIRRYDDIPMYDAFVSIMILIEGYMDKIMGTWERSANEQIKKFKKRVKCDEHSGNDADLFFAALDVVRHYRNFAVHSFVGMPNEDKKQIEKLTDLPVTFEELARTYDRPFKLPALLSNAPMDERTFVKRQFCISRMALVWIAKYSTISAKTP